MITKGVGIVGKPFVHVACNTTAAAQCVVPETIVAAAHIYFLLDS
jgi:hypothetical protein